MRNWDSLPDTLHKYDVEIFLATLYGYACIGSGGIFAMLGTVVLAIGLVGCRMKHLDSNSYTV